MNDVIVPSALVSVVCVVVVVAGWVVVTVVGWVVVTTVSCAEAEASERRPMVAAGDQMGFHTDVFGMFTDCVVTACLIGRSSVCARGIG